MYNLIEQLNTSRLVGPVLPGLEKFPQSGDFLCDRGKSLGK